MNSTALISDANRRFSSQYQGELANRLPMNLVALERMGASSERLRTYRDRYIESLEPWPHAIALEITTKNWQDYLGLNRYHENYLRYFVNCLATIGLRQTLDVHLPKLFDGVAGGAFHGLIRLGYALDSNNSEGFLKSCIPAMRNIVGIKIHLILQQHLSTFPLEPGQ